MGWASNQSVPESPKRLLGFKGLELWDRLLLAMPPTARPSLCSGGSGGVHTQGYDNVQLGPPDYHPSGFQNSVRAPPLLCKDKDDYTPRKEIKFAWFVLKIIWLVHFSSIIEDFLLVWLYQGLCSYRREGGGAHGILQPACHPCHLTPHDRSRAGLVSS